MTSTSPKPPRRSARERETRRHRILALFKGGMPYGAIGHAVNLSAERVRQIVVETLQSDRDAFNNIDLRLVLAARLEPAFQLAQRSIIEGRLEAVAPLVKVIDRLARLAPPAPVRRYDENARAKLMAKLNMNAERLFGREEEKNMPESPEIP
jgi:hypothetical protein